MADTSGVSRMLWLEVPASGRRVHVPGDGRDFLIGRSPTAALTLADPACSREHASLRWDGRTIELRPLALRQPTYVNDVAFDRVTCVVHGDVLRCGDSVVHVQLLPMAERQPPSGSYGLAAERPPRARPIAHDTATVLGSAMDQAPIAFPTAPVSVSGDFVLGRDQAVHGLRLEHPVISRRHAVILGGSSEPVVRDLGSSNGTFVNGEKLTAPQKLRDGDQLRIGPFVFEWKHGALLPVRDRARTELGTHALVVEVSADTGRRRLLDDVSIGIRAGEFVAVIGPSGCGKSTLIRALSGRSKPTSGAVSWAGVDLHRSFDAIKHEIAFVPQRETLPELLSVRECLTYTARLRLPHDSTDAEIAQLVREAIARVGLHEQADLRIGKLSGGQRKRASLANELLVKPSLVFLDEVTSGLDEATDREMMQVFRSLADSGIAVICVTHTLANVERWCDSLLVMARGGVVAFHGPVAAARAHFEVQALGDVYVSLSAVPAADWRPRHAAGSPFHARVTNRAAVRTTPTATGVPTAARSGRNPVAQFAVFTSRYLATAFADRRTLAMAAVQSIVIGGFLRLVFGDGAPAAPRDFQLLFLLGVSAFWFGCNNAAKEIIKERAMFELERDVNLRIPGYVFSKLVVLAGIGSLQVLVLLLVVRLCGLEFAEPTRMFGVMLLTVAAGTACGLCISAAASSEDQALTIVPIALIPQILLSDAVVRPLPDAARTLAQGTITAYWMYRAQLQALSTPGITGVNGAVMLTAHLVLFTAAAMIALWWRDRARRQ